MRLARLAAVVAFVAVVACGDDGRTPGGHQGGPPPPPPTARPRGRLVILGFDGVDPRWLEQWAAQGKLPNLKRLMDAGGGRGYRRLGSTNPPQSPVAWASFATGTEPGDHGIFDFIARSLRSGRPLPEVSTTQYSLPAAGPPIARNLRTGEPFWKTLGDDGVRVQAINVPYSFPADPMRDGRMLSGLGTPDVRGTNSTFTLADSRATADAQQPGGGQIVPLAMADGVGRFELDGPSVAGATAPMRVPVEVRVRNGALLAKVAGTEVPLTVGEPSGFIDVTFTGGGRTIKAVLKLLALEAGERVRLFVTPISFDPRQPFAPLSYPRGYAADLARAVGGPYKTVGWDHDTSALTAEVIDDDAFLRDVASVETQRRAMLLSRFDESDWDMLVWVSTATDRVSHMFYRLIDPQHPRYDAAAAALHGDAIEREYRRMDETVGLVAAKLRPEDTLVILSDHGFHDYRRGLQVNQWLLREGYLALRGGARSAAHEFLLDVDWARTKAYALGTGQIYLNLRGREPQGIVDPAGGPALLAEIRTKLLALADPGAGGVHPVHEVYLGSAVFRGGRSADAPDAQIAFAENYRTSWETILGGCPAELFTPNDKKWSGDHAASDVTETPGIVISSRPITRESPTIVDLAPTALTFFGRSVPPRYVGRPLFTVGR